MLAARAVVRGELVASLCDDVAAARIALSSATAFSFI
jgi:hypothetical protein